MKSNPLFLDSCNLLMKKYEEKILRAFKGIDKWTIEDFREEWKNFEERMKEAQKILKYIDSGGKKLRNKKKKLLSQLLCVPISIDTTQYNFSKIPWKTK